METVPTFISKSATPSPFLKMKKIQKMFWFE